MEMALEITLSAIVNFYILQLDTFGEVFSFALSILSLVILTVSSIILPFFIYKMKLKSHKQLMKEYLDEIIEDVYYKHLSG